MATACCTTLDQSFERFNIQRQGTFSKVLVKFLLLLRFIDS